MLDRGGVNAANNPALQRCRLHRRLRHTDDTVSAKSKLRQRGAARRAASSATSRSGRATDAATQVVFQDSRALSASTTGARYRSRLSIARFRPPGWRSIKPTRRRKSRNRDSPDQRAAILACAAWRHHALRHATRQGRWPMSATPAFQRSDRRNPAAGLRARRGSSSGAPPEPTGWRPARSQRCLQLSRIARQTDLSRQEGPARPRRDSCSVAFRAGLSREAGAKGVSGDGELPHSVSPIAGGIRLRSSRVVRTNPTSGSCLLDASIGSGLRRRQFDARPMGTNPRAAKPPSPTLSAGDAGRPGANPDRQEQSRLRDNLSRSV